MFKTIMESKHWIEKRLQNISSHYSIRSYFPSRRMNTEQAWTKSNQSSLKIWKIHWSKKKTLLILTFRQLLKTLMRASGIHAFITASFISFLKMALLIKVKSFSERNGNLTPMMRPGRSWQSCGLQTIGTNFWIC